MCLVLGFVVPYEESFLDLQSSHWGREGLFYLCLVFVMFSRLFIAALWSPAGKGLTSWLLCVMFNCVIVTFQCGILGQLWYLIVSIPDLCRLSYFVVILYSCCYVAVVFYVSSSRFHGLVCSV